MLGARDQIVLLADHTKFTTSAPVLLCTWDQVSDVVTDLEPSPEIRDQLARAGVTLHVA